MGFICVKWNEVFFMVRKLERVIILNVCWIELIRFLEMVIVYINSFVIRFNYVVFCI